MPIHFVIAEIHMMSRTLKLVAEILSRIQVQGSPATIHYGSRSSYPIGALCKIISGTQNISRRSLVKIFNVSQLLLELKDTFEKSGNKNKGMKLYLVRFRVRFLAFAWEKYHLTKIVGNFVKIQTRFPTNTEVRHIVDEWSRYKHSGMWCVVGRVATFRKFVRVAESGLGSHSMDGTATGFNKETKQRAS